MRKRAYTAGTTGLATTRDMPNLVDRNSRCLEVEHKSHGHRMWSVGDDERGPSYVNRTSCPTFVFKYGASGAPLADCAVETMLAAEESSKMDG